MISSYICSLVIFLFASFVHLHLGYLSFFFFFFLLFFLDFFFSFFRLCILIFILFSRSIYPPSPLLNFLLLNFSFISSSFSQPPFFLSPSPPHPTSYILLLHFDPFPVPSFHSFCSSPSPTSVSGLFIIPILSSVTTARLTATPASPRPLSSVGVVTWSTGGAGQ